MKLSTSILQGRAKLLLSLLRVRREAYPPGKTARLRFVEPEGVEAGLIPRICQMR